MGLGRLLEAQREREERDALRDVWRVTALARAISGEGVKGEDLLAELVGSERARKILEGPARGTVKAPRHADKG